MASGGKKQLYFRRFLFICVVGVVSDPHSQTRTHVHMLKLSNLFFCTGLPKTKLQCLTEHYPKKEIYFMCWRGVCSDNTETTHPTILSSNAVLNHCEPPQAAKARAS